MNQFSQVQGEGPDKELIRLMGDAAFGQVMVPTSNGLSICYFCGCGLPEWSYTLDHMIGSKLRIARLFSGDKTPS